MIENRALHNKHLNYMLTVCGVILLLLNVDDAYL
jgi:hypothetical protein